MTPAADVNKEKFAQSLILAKQLMRVWPQAAIQFRSAQQRLPIRDLLDSGIK